MQNDLKINGVLASTYGILFEHPSLEELLSFADSKAAVTNSSRHANGIQMDARNTKVESREVQLTISISAETETDFIDKHLALETLLRTGKNNTGMTEIGLERFLWHLRFDSCEPLRIFAGNKGARYALNFTEPDPTNRFAE